MGFWDKYHANKERRMRKKYSHDLLKQKKEEKKKIFKGKRAKRFVGFASKAFNKVTKVKPRKRKIPRYLKVSNETFRI